MSLSSLLINLKHPCKIKVLISMISFYTDSKLLNGIVYNVTKAFYFR